jgi:hypothetical protein
MVQAARNRSLVRCTPVGTPRPGPADGWWDCRVHVEEATGVPGWDHLLADAPGGELDALVPPDVVPGLSRRHQWSVVVELVGPHRIRIRSLA